MVLNDLVDSFCYCLKNARLKGLKKQVLIQLLSELRRVCNGAQVFTGGRSAPLSTIASRISDQRRPLECLTRARHGGFAVSGTIIPALWSRGQVESELIRRTMVIVFIIILLSVIQLPPLLPN